MNPAFTRPFPQAAKRSAGQDPSAWGARSGPLAWGAASFFGVLHMTLSVLHDRQLHSGGFDLGIFEQAIKAYSRGRAPIVPLKGPGANILGDHFSPILALLAPVYRIFPGTFTLLAAQSLLAALSLVPLTRWAHAACGPKAAWWTAIGLGCSWGLAEMVHFDFHEVAFAVPLLAFALTAAGQERWRAAALWSLPLLLVKEDLGATVAVLGCYIAWKGPRRTGIPLALLGCAASALEVLVLIPAANSNHTFSYASQISAGHSPWAAAAALLWPPVKWLTCLMVLAPTGFLALRSPLLLLAAPTLAWRFTADNPAYWGTHYHYSAVLMPIVFAAAVHTLAGHRRPSARTVRAAAALGLAFTAATVAVYPLHEVLLPKTWALTAHDTDARRLLDMVPDGVQIAASNHLAAQLVARTTVTEACQATAPEWVIYDTTDPTSASCPLSRLADTIGQHPLDGYEVLARSDGISLLRRIRPCPRPPAVSRAPCPDRQILCTAPERPATALPCESATGSRRSATDGSTSRVAPASRPRAATVPARPTVRSPDLHVPRQDHRRP